jgi:hypothetical protein
MEPLASIHAQMTYETFSKRAKVFALTVLGVVKTNTEDSTPAGYKTLVLLGLHEPDFWSFFQQEPEYLDGKPGPLHRWSQRVISTLANDLGKIRYFPLVSHILRNLPVGHCAQIEYFNHHRGFC